MSRSRGRSARTDNEFSSEQKIAHENKKLKLQIARLKKQIDRINSGWCPGCLQKHEAEGTEPMPPKVENIGKKVKKDRTCHKCQSDTLRIVMYTKMGEPWYLRRCPSCGHRTRGKKYTPDVEE
jgi:hypothetical protein